MNFHHIAKILSVINTFATAAIIYYCNHQQDTRIEAWAAAILGGIAAVAPHFAIPKDHE